MEALSISDYRKNLAASFSRAEKGEKVLIKRKNQLYALISVGREELIITPELQARIDEAEKACREGRCFEFSSPEELDKYFDNL